MLSVADRRLLQLQWSNYRDNHMICNSTYSNTVFLLVENSVYTHKLHQTEQIFNKVVEHKATFFILILFVLSIFK
jgi:hypothetical protein